MKKKRVLVTAIGTVTATAIVKALRDASEYYIIGADINDQYKVVTSLDVDEYHRFPYSTDEGYIPFALDFCQKHRVEYYYAVIDKEVVNLAKNRQRFAEVGTKLCVVNHEFAEICHFKDRFCKWIEENYPSIAIKTYRDIKVIEEADFPLFVKPVEGVASTDCRRVDNRAALAEIIHPDEIDGAFIVQDYVEGQNITVDCVRNAATGQVIQIQRRELLRNSNGCGIAVEIFHDTALEDICRRLVEKLKLNGVVNIEFFDTGNGYRIIEINPRFSAGTRFSCMAGVNTVLNAMLIADGKACEGGEVEIGAHFAERYEAYRM